MSYTTVTRAAAALNISQPAVSQLIAELERGCGFPLFTRESGRLVPTREADALLAEVHNLFTGVQKVARVATALREMSWGVLSVAAFPALAKRVIPEIVADYCRERPDIRFKIQSMRSRALIDAVATQHVDLGLSVMPGDRDEVESIKLQKLPAVCVLPRRHRLAAKAAIHATDLANERFISLGLQDKSRMLIDKIFDDLQVPRVLQIETGQSEVAVSLVANGAGISVVDPVTLMDNRDDRIVVRPFVPKMEFIIWLILPRQQRPMLLLDDFRKFVRREVAAVAKRLKTEA